MLLPLVDSEQVHTSALYQEKRDESALRNSENGSYDNSGNIIKHLISSQIPTSLVLSYMPFGYTR